MKIDILCSDEIHPVIVHLKDWLVRKGPSLDGALLSRSEHLRGGDILFLVSCSEIIGRSIRDRYRHVLVIHASDLPLGRGWSPHVWQLLDGAETITVALLEAEDAVDTGLIWAKRTFEVPAHFLFDEISDALFQTEIALMDDALRLAGDGARLGPQDDEGATYYGRRKPADSEIDPQRALADLFNSIRVCDPDRYPAFFRMHGHRYVVELRKAGQDE